MANDTTYFRLGLAFDQPGASAVDKALEEFQQRQIKRGEQYLMASEAQSKRILEARLKRQQDIANAQNMEIARRAKSEQDRAQAAVRNVELIYQAEQQKLRATAQAWAETARVEHGLRNDRLQSARTAISEEMRLEQQLAETKMRAAATAQQADANARNQRLANARAVLASEQELTRIQLAAEQERARIASGALSASTRARHTLMDSNMGGRTGRGVGWDFLGGQSFRTIGFQLRAIPGGGIAETIGRLSPLLDVMTELATGTGAASAGVLGLVGGLVALGVVVGSAIENIRRLTEEYKRNLEVQERTKREAALRTNEENQARQREIEAELTPRRRQLQSLEGQLPGVFNEVQLANLGGGVLSNLGGIFGDRARRAEAAFGSLLQQIGEERRAIVDLEAEHTNITMTLLEGTNAAAERAEAERELAEQRLREFQNQLDWMLAADRMTKEQRDERIREIRRELNAINLLSIGQEDNALITEEVAQRTSDLQAELAFLGAVTQSTADVEATLAAQREKEEIDKQKAAGRELQLFEQLSEAKEKALQDELKLNLQIAALKDQEAANELKATMQLTYEKQQLLKQEQALAAAEQQRRDQLANQTDMLFESQTALGEALEAVRVATEAYDAAAAEHEQRLTDIALEAEEKRIEAVADAAKDMADAEKDAQKKREEQEKEHRDRIAEINRKADRDIANAIGNRDALAAYLAEQQRQDELADEAARNKDRLEQIEEAYDDQKKAIQERLDDQLDQIKKAADKAANAERKRYADQARDLQAAIDKQKAMVWNAENQLTAIRTGFQNTRVIAEMNWYATLDNVANSYQNAMLFRWRYFWGQLLGGMPASPALGGTPDHGTPWGGWAGFSNGARALDRRIDQRIGMTLRGGVQ